MTSRKTVQIDIDRIDIARLVIENLVNNIKDRDTLCRSVDHVTAMVLMHGTELAEAIHGAYINAFKNLMSELITLETYLQLSRSGAKLLEVSENILEHNINLLQKSASQVLEKDMEMTGKIYRKIANAVNTVIDEIEKLCKELDTYKPGNQSD